MNKTKSKHHTKNTLIPILHQILQHVLSFFHEDKESFNQKHLLKYGFVKSEQKTFKFGT